MYCCGLIVAPLSKNFTNKIPSLFKKTLAITLATEVCTLNFFSCVVISDGTIPLIVFCQWVVGLSLGFITSNYS